MMRAILGLLASVALLSGCGLEDMKGGFEKSQLVSKVEVLESAAAEAIGKAFASRPEQIFVQIANQARN